MIGRFQKCLSLSFSFMSAKVLSEGKNANVGKRLRNDLVIHRPVSFHNVQTLKHLFY